MARNNSNPGVMNNAYTEQVIVAWAIGPFNLVYDAG
jgi:hypothetical protein